MILNRLLVFRQKFSLASYVLICILTLTAVTFFYRQFHSIEITVSDNGEIYRLDSKADDVEGFFREQGLIFSPFDRISPGLGEPLEKGMKITIDRAFPVTITTATGSFKHYSHADTVYGVIKELGIPLAGYYVEPDLNESTYSGKEIFISRQLLSIDTVRETIDYPVKKQMDDTVLKGRSKLVQEGREGIKELRFRVVYAGGKELLRECIGEEIVKEPVPSIVAVGTKPLPKAPVIIASRGESIEGMASWYGSEFHGRKTSSNEIFDQDAYTAAHRSLPFGSYLKVTFLKTGKSTLVRINDRGPGDRGRLIDLSKAAAEAIGLRAYGVGRVRIEVVEVGK